jgi:cytochrome P450
MTAASLFGPGLDGATLPSLYEKLRIEYGPVAPVTIAPGIDAWLVIGHRELLRVTRDEQFFSHDPRRWTLLRDGRVPPESPLLPVVGWRPAALYADGRQHRRHREAVAAALTAVDGHELRRTVRDAAEGLIAGFADRGQADLVPHYARKLPIRVVMQLLDLDEPTGQQLAQDVAGTAAVNADSGNAGRRMAGILRDVVSRRRGVRGRGPAGGANDDLTSALLRHPAELTDEEVLHNLAVIFVTGNQATVNWIATTLRVLLTDTAFRGSLAGGHLTVDDALDLVLWRYPPMQNFPARYATRDLEFGGQDVRSGDMLILGIAGANADPEVLPDDGVPVAGNRSHLAFGAGPHVCPAHDPARLITRTAVDTLRHRLPDVELAVPEGELTWISSPWATGLAALPVRFTEPQLAAGV